MVFGGLRHLSNFIFFMPKRSEKNSSERRSSQSKLPHHYFCLNSKRACQTKCALDAIDLRQDHTLGENLWNFFLGVVAILYPAQSPVSISFSKSWVVLRAFLLSLTLSMISSMYVFSGIILATSRCTSFSIFAVFLRVTVTMIAEGLSPNGQTRWTT